MKNDPQARQWVMSKFTIYYFQDYLVLSVDGQSKS